MNNEMLIRSLAQVFEGVCGIFKSLEALEELPKDAEAADETPPKDAEAADETPPKVSKTEPQKISEAPKTSFTYDKVLDIVGTKVQKKLEAGDKDINKRIKELIVKMGYEKLPELPPEMYEEFLTKLSEI